MSEVQKEGKKRKKKRSYVQMAKKFARRRHVGQNLDQDTYQYLLRIVEVMRKDFPTSDERTLFVKNVYGEMAGREIEYACSQLGSRVIDSLLKYASLEDIQGLIKQLEPSLRKLLNNKFASHVLQKVIEVCADRGNRISDTNKTEKTKTSKENAVTVVEVKPGEKKVYNNIVLKLTKYILNNAEEFVSDMSATYVVCTAIECLAGLIDPDSENSKKSAAVCLANRRPVIQDYTDLLVQTCNRLHKWPQFYELTQDKQSFLVHCILYSLKDVDSELTNVIINKIIDECFKVKERENQTGTSDTKSLDTKLLETCLITADSKSFKKLYETFFAGNLKTMSLGQSTNFSVQRLLDHCNTKEDLEQIFDELSEHLPEIFKLGFTGVLVSIANACARLQTKQGAFVTAMTKLLECDKTENETQLVRCMVTLKSPARLKESDDSHPPLMLHGSLITQAILNFNKPIKLVNSILAMSNEQLLRLFDNPMGSHILDAFMDSKYIGEKSREKLRKTLRGVWTELAKGKHGSRCLDKIWSSAHMSQKQVIMEELAAAGESLKSTQSGKITFNKLNVPLFARNKKDWTDAQDKGDKIKTMFADIIGKK